MGWPSPVDTDVDPAQGTVWRTRILPNTWTVFGKVGGTVPDLPAGKEASRWVWVAELAQ